MKNLFALVLLILAVIPAFGQIQYYQAYQKSIHAAELHLVRGQNKEALNKYQEVLIPSDGNFVKDVYNALLVADELGESGCFFELLELLLPKNLEQNYLNDLPVFRKWQNDARWQAFSATNKKTEVRQPELKAKLEQLHQDDQFFRVKEGSYDVYGDTIKHIDSINMAYLLGLIASDRFPGEALIGAQDLRSNQPTDVLFHHYCQSTSEDNSKRKITSELIGLVQAGKVLPNKCGLWLDFQNADFDLGVFEVMSFEVDGVKSALYVPELNSTQLLVVEKNRKLLGMEPLEEYYEKIRFNEAYQAKGYVFDVTQNIFPVNQQIFEALTENMREL